MAKNKPKFKCTSEAQKRAIRKSYAEKADGTVTVNIKNHKDKKGGHPHIIIEDIDDKHVSVGLTHDNKKGKNSTNYTMESNPLGGKKKSYMHRQGTVDSKKMYYGNRKGKITETDYTKARTYADKAKQKYIENKKK